MTDLPAVELADFMAALRNELRVAQSEADGDLPIEIGSITVEFAMTTRREGDGSAGVKFWIIDAGFTGKIAKESTQKMTIELTPRDRNGIGPMRIRDIGEGATLSDRQDRSSLG